MEANFLACLRHVLAMEGGFVMDPSDHGGATNWGITAATLAHWRGHAVSAADVRSIQLEEARAIYHANYWNTVRGDACHDWVLSVSIRTSIQNLGLLHSHAPVRIVQNGVSLL